jgi:hypothetical protein
MCILVVCEPNHTPTKESLDNGACANPHGYGFAIIADGVIISERSMSAKKSIKRFLELREQYPNGYAMWHARYATHGVKNEQNCHPFQVGVGNELTYLAHNGILDVVIPEKDKRSDTRIFAEDTLPLMGGVTALDDDTIWVMVSKWAGTNKIAVLTVDPEAGSPMYLVNEKLGIWEGGVWYSNAGYKPKVSYIAPTANVWRKADDKVWDSYIESARELSEKDVDVCIYCDAIVDLEENEFYCTTCDMCYDCLTHIADCLCYTPTNEWGKVTWRSNRDLDLLY